MESTLQQKEQQTDNLSLLNHDCLYEIFDYLSLSDLCSVGMTCKVLKGVAGTFFARNYPNELANEITIAEHTGEFRFRHPQNWVISFSQVIQNVRILDLKEKTSIRLSVFMNAHFNEGNLKKIVFFGGVLPTTLGTRINNLLVNIETLEFSTCKGQIQTLDSFFERCPHLKHLKITSDSPSPQFNSFWLPSKKWESLELLQFQFERKTVGQLIRLLRGNLNINTIACHFRNRNDVEEFLSIIQNFENIEKLYLSFNCQWSGPKWLEKKAKLLNEMQHLRRLEMRFVGADRRSDEMSALHSFSGLHVDFSSKFITQWTSPVNCEILHIHCGTISVPFIRSLARRTLNLKELYLTKCVCFDIEHLTTFVQLLPKLSKLLVTRVWGEKLTRIMINVHKMNEERKKLPDACKLTVLYQCSRIELKNATDNDDLVLFKKVDVKNLSFNTENPFIDFSVRVI